MAHYGCKCATEFDEDTGRWICSVTDDECFYFIPNSKACAEDFGEGPDVSDDHGEVMK